MRRLIIVIVLLGAGYIYFSAGKLSDLPVKKVTRNTSDKVEEKENKHVEKVETLSTVEPIKHGAIFDKCQERAQWVANGGEANISNFRKEFLLEDDEFIIQYSSMSEQELLNIDAPIAKYVLGHSYWWQSFSKEFKPGFALLGTEQPVLVKKRFDRKISAKARESFFEAALGGYPTGLLHIGNNIKREIIELRKIALDDEEEIKALEMKSLAYISLMINVAPQISSNTEFEKYYLSDVAKLTEEDKEYFDMAYGRVHTKWIKGRELLGLEPVITFDLSPEDLIFWNSESECAGSYL